MKTVNYIGLRETAGIAYVVTNKSSLTIETFLYHIAKRFDNYKNMKFKASWADGNKEIQYILWR